MQAQSQSTRQEGTTERTSLTGKNFWGLLSNVQVYNPDQPRICRQFLPPYQSLHRRFNPTVFKNSTPPKDSPNESTKILM